MCDFWLDQVHGYVHCQGSLAAAVILTFLYATFMMPAETRLTKTNYTYLNVG